MIIIIFIILLFIFLLYLIFKKVETYEDVKINNDFYIPVSVINNLSNKKINASKLCIFERNQDKITDIECISGDELLVAMNLPKERKQMVCIDNNCINFDDIKILNGTSQFKIKSASKNSTFEDKCLGDTREVKLRRCGHNIPDNNNEKVNTLAPYTCTSNDSINFLLNLGDNSDKNLIRSRTRSYQTMPVAPTINFVEGHIIR